MPVHRHDAAIAIAAFAALDDRQRKAVWHGMAPGGGVPQRMAVGVRAGACDV